MRKIYALRNGRMVRIDKACNPVSSASAICSKRPWLSEGMGCHPSQVNEFNKRAAHGRYLPDGRYEATSRSGRAAEMRSRGLFDRDAGFGDHSGS